MINFDKYVNSFLNEDSTPGGLADNKTCNDIAKKHGVSVDKIKQELAKGIKVEMEHTDNAQQAKEISKDHLYEMPDYYSKLAKMETESNVAGGAGSAFGQAAGYNIGDHGGDVGNSDFYAPGDARMPKSIFGGVLRRNSVSTSKKKKRKKKNNGRKKEK